MTEKSLENVPGNHPLFPVLVEPAQPGNLGVTYCACLGAGTLGGGMGGEAGLVSILKTFCWVRDRGRNV